jgi:hypothetical protein
MSLVGEPFGGCWGTPTPRRNPRPENRPESQPTPPPSNSDLFNELESFSGDRERYDQEYGQFRELLDRTKGMDQQEADKDTRAGQVDARVGRERFQLERTADGFELSHEKTGKLPPGMMSMAGPPKQTTNYKILPDSITKTFHDSRNGERETLVMNTRNHTIQVS